MMGLSLEVKIELLIGGVLIAIGEFLLFVWFFFRYTAKQDLHNKITEQRLDSIDKAVNNVGKGEKSMRESISDIEKSLIRLEHQK